MLRARGRLVGARQFRSSGSGLDAVLVETLHLGLEDAHRLAERTSRARELRRSEEHDEHHGDDQDLPWTVKQVANHVCPFSGMSTAIGVFQPVLRRFGPRGLPTVRDFWGNRQKIFAFLKN